MLVSNLYFIFKIILLGTSRCYVFIYRLCYNKITTIINNKSYDNYAAIFIRDAYNAKIIDSIISNNYAYLNGGGLMLQNCEEIIVKGCIFDSNEVKREKGGSLYIEDGYKIEFYNNTFSKNYGYFGSALYMYNSKHIYFEDTLVTKNIASF